MTPGAIGISGRLPVAAGSPGRPGLLVVIFILAFTLYVAVENGTGGWMTSHLESIGLASKDAATLTSGFWLALVTGRLLITLVPTRVPEAAIVTTGAAVATVALLAASIGVVAPEAYNVAAAFLGAAFPARDAHLAYAHHRELAAAAKAVVGTAR